MTLDEQFQKAQVDVKSLASKPSNDVLLKLYAFFKQAAEGDISGDRPGGFDFKGMAKYDAWAEISGKSADEAKQAYVDLVASLLA